MRQAYEIAGSLAPDKTGNSGVEQQPTKILPGGCRGLQCCTKTHMQWQQVFLARVAKTPLWCNGPLTQVLLALGIGEGVGGERFREPVIKGFTFAAHRWIVGEKRAHIVE